MKHSTSGPRTGNGTSDAPCGAFRYGTVSHCRCGSDCHTCSSSMSTPSNWLKDFLSTAPLFSRTEPGRLTGGEVNRPQEKKKNKGAEEGRKTRPARETCAASAKRRPLMLSHRSMMALRGLPGERLQLCRVWTRVCRVYRPLCPPFKTLPSMPTRGIYSRIPCRFVSEAKGCLNSC